MRVVRFLMALLFSIVVVPSMPADHGYLQNRYLSIVRHQVSGNYLYVDYHVKYPTTSVRLIVRGFDSNGHPVRTTFCDVLPVGSTWGDFGRTRCVIPGGITSVDLLL